MRRGARLARTIVRCAAWLVPRAGREEWVEEWRAELTALEAARDRAGDGADVPGVIGFALGALPHAVWTRTEGWTMGGWVQDVRHAARRSMKAPGFLLAAALTLALGIGANASVFSLVNGILLRPPPGVAEPERLVQLARSYEDDPRWDNFSWPAFELIRREATALEGAAGYVSESFVLGRGAEAERVAGERVTGDYFRLLGVRPHLGRLIGPDDDVEPGAHPVVVLAHGLWVRRFGSDPDVVGATVAVGARPYEVVGVAPPGFAGVETVGAPPALWMPTMQTPARFGLSPFEEWGWSWLSVFGRVRVDADLDAVRASMQGVATRLRAADPVNEGILVRTAEGLGLDPGERAEAARLSRVLLLIVGVLLLLTCANVASLFLARLRRRRSELAVRAALGGGRARLVRELLTECLLVAGLATALAIPLVKAAERFLPLLFPYALAVPPDLDGRVLGVLVLAGVVTGVLFGVVPALAGTRGDLAGAVREGGAGEGASRTRLRDALIVGQVALSLALVTGGVLLARSVWNARTAQPGFEPVGLTGASVDLGSTGRYDGVERNQVFERMRRAAEAVPGVVAATLADQLPLLGGHARASASPLERDDATFEAERVIVGRGYFETVGIPIVAGRVLRGLGEEPERVVVVSESLARMFWPGRDPLGRILVAQGEEWRVVGVAGDVQMRSLRESGRPAVYYPMAHNPSEAMVIQVRGEGGRSVSGSTLREAIASVDPAVPVPEVVQLDGALAASLGEVRTLGYLMGTFAALALLLAAVGLYGLVAHTVSERVREMGIRMALGARPRAVAGLALTHGMAVSLGGIVLGLGLSWLVGTALERTLFGVSPLDPLALVTASVLLLGTALVAAWIPARRAGRIDPVRSLRV